MWGSFVGLLAAILTWLTSLTGSLGLGIILFTIFTRIAMLPLTIKQLQSSKKMQELQPLVNELRRKHGKDQQKFTQEMTKLYREHKANPVGGCLPIFIQLPIFLGVWSAIQRLAANPDNPIANSPFLWLPSLAEKDPLYILPVLSIVFQLIVSLMAMPKIQDAQQKMMSQMMLLMPIAFGYVAFTFNSGAVLYWVMGSILAMVQQYFVTGWGSLSNYLTFLPERKGYLTPVMPTLPLGGGSSEETTEEKTPEPQAGFWAPLAKLQTQPAAPAPEPPPDTPSNDGRPPRRSKKRR